MATGAKSGTPCDEARNNNCARSKPQCRYHWNAITILYALIQLHVQGSNIDPHGITRLSPVLWRHINAQGRYDINLPDSVAVGKLRPFRDPTSAEVL
ncbi:MAG: Tn3 family transposase [Rhodobacteraceae bacterium]|nr:Tn3 family transposase [Paracoccaceae bacterium]